MFKANYLLSAFNHKSPTGMRKTILPLALLLHLTAISLHGQTKADTATKPSKIDTSVVLKKKDVIVVGERIPEVGRLEPIQGTYIFSGKKSEVINLVNTGANLPEKTGRQVFAKVPGIFVYDMDGSGNQVNISTRGLDPHRGWEFNIRKDGIITNSDIYGYPASHFSVPLESIEKIEIVRGTGSLQYGSQFGGMINYITKAVDTTREFGSEVVNTIGSFGLFSTHISVGGKINGTTYQAYVNKRGSDGYRDNARTVSDAEQITISRELWKDAVIRAELSRSSYLYQIPGPLTDSMFRENPRQSTRSRNYFNPAIYIPSISFDWKINSNSHLSFLSSAVLGDRNSIQFDKPANIRDTVNAATLLYNNRQVDVDHFHSYTNELRFLQYYDLLNQHSSVVAGAQYMNNDLHRQQLGKGSTGSDFDMELVQPGWGRDIHLKTANIAFFVENHLKISDDLSVNTGVRVESGKSEMSGSIVYIFENEIPNTINHKFALFGGSIEYRLNENSNIYTGFSQAYRPVVFKDIIPSSIYERVDKDLKDARGYNLDIGYRGKWDVLKWDISLFQLRCDNRMGNLSTTDSSGTFLLYRTNIGDSYVNGAEAFIEANVPLSDDITASLFTSTSVMDGRYENAAVKSGNTNIDVSNNKVETVPEIITRNGLTLKFSSVSCSMLYSYVGDSYADALNTVIPSATGSVGLVPAYGVLDLNATVQVTNALNVRINANNVTDKQYFTKRPAFYPGPGVWSSDGRSFSLTVGVRL